MFDAKSTSSQIGKGGARCQKESNASINVRRICRTLFSTGTDSAVYRNDPERRQGIGGSSRFSTDVGPVIDQEAFEGIHQHLQRLNAQEKPLAAPVFIAQKASKSIANLIAPQTFEVKSIAQMRQEIFGSVLHIVRWNGDPQEVVAQINALGYGLTISAG